MTVKFISPTSGIRPRGAPLTNNARNVSNKRVNNLRFSWFVLGSVFGLAVSFLMNFFVSAIILPEYQRFTGSKTEESQIAALDALDFSDEDARRLKEIEKVEAPITYPLELRLTVKSGDTLNSLLAAHKVSADEALDIVSALKKTYNPRSINIGQKIYLKLVPSKEAGRMHAVEQLEIATSSISSVALNRIAGGAFSVATSTKEMSKELTFASGTIHNSLFDTGNKNGVPEGVLAELVKAYSYDVDFQRQIHPGDHMEVLFDKMVTEDGVSGGYGDIYYAQLRLQGKKLKIYRYKDRSGLISYYNEKGESIIKALLKTPINGARISSGFGNRRHPILGYTKMHKGTDFAATTGTPIYAAGDGVITHRGWQGGYGNYVRIRHNGTYSTAYGHMSRFASGLGNGSRVKQGQVIGYVGSTGRSTGPHLHYEVLKFGSQVNPMSQKFNTGNTLGGTELANFRAQISKIDNQVASLSKSGTHVASLSDRNAQ